MKTEKEEILTLIFPLYFPYISITEHVKISGLWCGSLRAEFTHSYLLQFFSSIKFSQLSFSFKLELTCFIFLINSTAVLFCVMSRLITRIPLGHIQKKRIHWCLNWRHTLNGLESTTPSPRSGLCLVFKSFCNRFWSFCVCLLIPCTM